MNLSLDVPNKQVTLHIQNIISKSLKGNRAAQRLLFDQYSPRLYKVAMRYCRQSANAQDVMQEAWIKIFNNLDKVDNLETFYPWCKKIVVNTALRSLQHRWLNTQLTDQMEPLDSTATPSILNELSDQAIRQVIDQLPAGYRDIFLLHHVEGYKHEEIGNMLNIAPSTSRAKLSLARKRLRKLLIQNKMAI